MSELSIIQYQLQKNGAKRRGIEWDFTFDDWLDVWTASGHANKRGRGKGCYVMGRHGDVGPYSRANVSIIPFEQNTADGHANGRHQYRKVQLVTALSYDFERPPIAVAEEVVLSCGSYREAVRVAWEMRVIQRMTRLTLSELIGAYAAHVTDYLNPDDLPTRRDMPARCIPDFEWTVGNTLVSQWIAMQVAAPQAERSLA